MTRKDLSLPVLKLLEEIKLSVSVQDLKDFEYGSYFDQGIYKIYLKLLKIFSDVMLDIHEFN